MHEFDSYGGEADRFAILTLGPWFLKKGDVIAALTNMTHADIDATIFTAGKAYDVIDISPIGANVTVIDDTGVRALLNEAMLSKFQLARPAR